MASPMKETLEEEFCNDAPEHLLDPITFKLFHNPVVAPSGETYDLATLSRTKSDPFTREELPQDLSKLPVNRALKRQVDSYVQKKLERVASNAENDLPSALACLRLTLGRTEDCCLNGTRAIVQSLQQVGPKGAAKLSPKEQQDLDMVLQRLGEARLGEELLPELDRTSTKRQPPPRLLPPGEQTPLSQATTPAGGHTWGGGGGQVGGAAAAAGRPVCAACSAPVNPAHAKVGGEEGDKLYHPACFRCAACTQEIQGKHQVHGGRLVCAPCFTDLTCDRCPACGEGVSAGQRLKGRVYHHGCVGAAGSDGAPPPAPSAAGGGGGAGAAGRVCCGCGKGIAGQCLELMGKHWHGACLTCGECGVGLEKQRIMSKDEGPPLCVACYGDLHLPKCGRCSAPVAGDGVVALERSWCEGCWVCGLCDQRLGTGSFWRHDDGAVCHGCYVSIVLEKCVGCGLGAEETVTCESMPGKVWHPECFRCSACKEVLEGRFHHKDGSLYCAGCYASHFLPRCASCGKPIADGALTALDRTWHQSCFTCALCRKPVTSKRFHTTAASPGEGDALPVCDPCHEAKVLPRCGACARPIKERSCAVFKGQKMHRECFCCRECKAPIDSKYFEKEGGEGVVCQGCVAKDTSSGIMVKGVKGTR